MSLNGESYFLYFQHTQPLSHLDPVNKFPSHVNQNNSYLTAWMKIDCCRGFQLSSPIVLVMRFLREWKVKSSEDVISPFLFYFKAFGFSTIVYPSKSMKTSPIGLALLITNVVAWIGIIYAIETPLGGFSTIFQSGIFFIYVFNTISSLASLLVNFVRRKALYQLLEALEDFDKKVS